MTLRALAIARERATKTEWLDNSGCIHTRTKKIAIVPKVHDSAFIAFCGSTDFAKLADEREKMIDTIKMCQAVFQMFTDVESGDVGPVELANSTNKAIEMVDELLKGLSDA